MFIVVTLMRIQSFRHPSGLPRHIRHSHSRNLNTPLTDNIKANVLGSQFRPDFPHKRVHDKCHDGLTTTENADTLREAPKTFVAKLHRNKASETALKKFKIASSELMKARRAVDRSQKYQTLKKLERRGM